MTYAFIALSVAVFVISVRLLGVVEVARSSVESVRAAASILQSSDLDEYEKEKRIQAASLRMIRDFLRITARFGGSLALSLAVPAAGVAIGLFTAAALVAAASDWTVIVLASAAAVAAMIPWK